MVYALLKMLASISERDPGEVVVGELQDSVPQSSSARRERRRVPRLREPLRVVPAQLRARNSRKTVQSAGALVLVKEVRGVVMSLRG